MVDGELSEVLLLLGCWQLFEVRDRGGVGGLVGADEHLGDVSCLVQGLTVQSLVALHNSREVHQLQGQGGTGGREKHVSKDCGTI